MALELESGVVLGALTDAKGEAHIPVSDEQWQAGSGRLTARPRVSGVFVRESSLERSER